MATSQILVWDSKFKKYIYKTTNVLENDYVKQQQAQKVLNGVNNIIKNTQQTKTQTSAKVGAYVAPKNPVINSVANMVQQTAQKKPQNTFKTSANPVEVRKQIDQTVKKYQAVNPKQYDRKKVINELMAKNIFFQTSPIAGTKNSVGSQARYILATDEELKKYDSMAGKEKSDYLKELDDILDQRMGLEEAKAIQNIKNKPLKKIMTGLTSYVGGYDEAIKGLKQVGRGIIGDDKPVQRTAIGEAQKTIAPTLEGVEKTVNEILFSGGQMTPAILTGMATGGLGAAPAIANLAGATVTGLSSAGSTYGQTVEQGYTPDQARVYGLINGVLEGGLHYGLGGIKGTSFGGASKLLEKTGIVKQVAAKLANAPKTAQVLTKMAASRGDEAVEEYLQAVLDPVIRNITLGENNKFDPLSPDKLYPAGLGLLMANFANLPSDISTIASTVKTAEDISAITAKIGEGKASEILAPETSTKVETQTPAVTQPANNTVQRATSGVLANDIGESDLQGQINGINEQIEVDSQNFGNPDYQNSGFPESIAGMDISSQSNILREFAAYELDKDTKDRINTGKPPEHLIRDVADSDNGTDISNFDHYVLADGIRHGLKHDEESGNIPITSEDVSMIPLILSGYDDITITKKRGGETSIKLVKYIDGKIAYVMTLGKKKGWLFTRNLWKIDSQEIQNGSSRRTDAKAPALTPEAAAYIEPSIADITQPGSVVNKPSEIDRAASLARSAYQENINAQEPLENIRSIYGKHGDTAKDDLSVSGTRGTGNPVLDRISMLIQNGSGINRGNAPGAANTAYTKNPVLEAIRALTQNNMAQFAKPSGRNNSIPPGMIETSDETKSVLKNRNTQWDKASGELEKFAARMKRQGLFLNERQLRVLKAIADSVAEMREKQAAVNNRAKKLVQDILFYAVDLKTRKQEGSEDSRLAGNTADREAPGIADRTGQSIIGIEDAGDYEPDILIGKSLGAKAKNYDIFTPDGEILNLSEGTHIRNIEVITGQGRYRQIDMVDSLVDKYGGDRAKWKKCKGLGYVDVDSESYLVELHWYEEPSTGRVEFKIKRQPGGAWFINED